MTGAEVRPDRHALLEPDALLEQIELLVGEADSERFASDVRYRWILHRVWIAVGNESLAYATLTGRNAHADQPWASLYLLRNLLAHQRLPDIDEDNVWRASVLRPARLRKQVRSLLR